MKLFKFFFCCLCWNAFVLSVKGQVVGAPISYELIKTQSDKPNSLEQIIIKNKKGQVLVRSKSLRFELEAGIIIQAQNTKTILYLYQKDGKVDSIGHDKVDFVYDIAKKTLFLEISSQGNQASFYTNSLHKIDVRAQNIEWKMEEQELYFDNKATAICFTSIHHFDAPLMEAYQSLGNTNPLIKMALYAEKKRSSKAWFDLKELALLLDKRLEKIVLMDSIEVEKARRNPAFKIIKNKQDFEQFRKGYPTVFKFAGMNVEDLKRLIQGSGIDEKMALPLYLKMVKDGFLDYNKNTQQIQLQDKLFHYVASMNRKSNYDYDHFKFWSQPMEDKAINSKACLDFKTQLLKIPNVKQIILGKTQQVIAKPSDVLYLLPNRGLRFNGQIGVGRTCFEGIDFQFEYDNYRVVLPRIERLNLAIYKRVRIKNEWAWGAPSVGRERALNEQGKPTKEVEFIQSVIEGGKGYLKIDRDTNKSGKNDGDKEGVTFFSTSFSRVYYDKVLKEGQLVYPRKSFYYELEPFQLKNMNRLDIEMFSFKGKFYSSEILPLIENDLSLQIYDLSLGFDTILTQGEKMPLYLREEASGKGSFYGQLRLSNEGLIGNGILTYLGASLGCDVFDFLPEEVHAKQVDSFRLEASKRFPRVYAKHIKMLWKPYEKQMYLNSLFTEGFPFHFYYKDEKYRLDGQLRMSPKGLFGKGTLDWKQASIISNPKGAYQIQTNRIESESVAVLLKIRGQTQFCFEQENVRLDLDFEKSRARFTSKDEKSSATFPYNAYQTTMNEFDWDWKRNLLFMKSENGQKGIFKKDDSQWTEFDIEASKGIYDLNIGVLQLKDLAPIKIGNALLYLTDSILEIEAEGYISELEGNWVLKDSSFNLIYTLNEVNLVWNTKTNSFVSKGESLALKRNEEVDFKLVNGKIEILPRSKGLEVQYVWFFSNGDWCFLKWKEGVLYGLSNHGAIDGILLGELDDFESFRARWW